MRTLTRARTVVIVGARPRSNASEALGDVRPGDEVAVFALGLDPTPGQRAFTDEALTMAAEGRFILTAELIPGPSWLRERLLRDDKVRVIARTREARRWRIEPREFSAPDA